MATHPDCPPRVLRVSCGRIQVEGVGSGKDFKLYPGGGRAWDWAETGTARVPGTTQPADVEELLGRGATSVVLSRGMNLALQVALQTSRLIEKAGVAVQVAQTSEAVDIYNRLAATEPVGALFHSTC